MYVGLETGSSSSWREWLVWVFELRSIWLHLYICMDGYLTLMSEYPD